MRIRLSLPLVLLVACSVGEGNSGGLTAGLSSAGETTSASTSASTTVIPPVETSTSSGDAQTSVSPTSGSEGTTADPTQADVTSSSSSTSTTAGEDTSTSEDTTSGSETTEAGPMGEECSPEERQLIDLANARRVQAGLPIVAVNDALCAVAHAHTVDLAEQSPQDAPGCGVHSWSGAGVWDACCHPIEAPQSTCTWQKPRQIGPYSGIGHELVAVASANPVVVLADMQAVNYQNAILLNTAGIWGDSTWRAVGASIYGGYAVLWYGEPAN